MKADDEEAEGLEGGGGNDYFASLTDLMTGVVFIFVILLTAYALVVRGEQERAARLAAEAEAARAAATASEADLRRQRELLQQEQGRNRENARTIEALAQLLRDREKARREMLEKLVSRLEGQGVRVDADLDNGVIRLPENLLFDVGKADLRPEGRIALVKIAQGLITVVRPWCLPSAKFRLESFFIEGHTDNVPIFNDEFHNNWELSTARAVNTSLALTETARDLLVLKNPSGKPILGVSGYGENRPVAPNLSDAGRSANRRIELRFLMAYPTSEQFRQVQRILESQQTN
jgi:chemotaxis protein MotB